MLLPKFDYIRPESLEEASRYLTDGERNARLMAGGTDLLPRMKYALVSCDSLVSLQNLPVREPEATPDGELRLDAMMRLADLAEHPVVRGLAPGLAEAALEVGSNQVRQMATLGGNLCQDTRCLYLNQEHTFQFIEPCLKRGGDLCYFMPKGKKCWAVFMSDTATALIALGARVELVQDGRKRRLPLALLYSKDSNRPLTLLAGEILSEVVVPPLPERSGNAFVKFAMRGGVEFAGLNVAATLTLEADGATCREAGLAVGAVGAAPLKLTEAPKALIGKTVDDEALALAASKAAEESRPYPHHCYQAPYLRKVLAVKAGEAIGLALQRALSRISEPKAPQGDTQ